MCHGWIVMEGKSVAGVWTHYFQAQMMERWLNATGRQCRIIPNTTDSILRDIESRK